MQTYIILVILFIHWVADFVMQKEEDAINKWHSNTHLLSHTMDYAAYFIVPMWLLFAANGYNIVGGMIASAIFCVITFIIHTTTDFFTSKWTHKLYENKNIHKFFVVIGFDQFLHFLQLILTWKLIFYVF